MTEISSTVVSCVQLLELISDGRRRRPRDLAEELGLSRSSVQRLLSTLEGRGLLARAEAGHVLSTRMRVMADRIMPALRGVAFNAIRELADDCRETVVLLVDDGPDAVVLDEAVPTTEHSVRARLAVGTRQAAGGGAAAIVHLAHRDVAARTRATRRRPDLAEAIARAREQGWLLMRSPAGAEVTELAVPVLDEEERVLASIAVLAPTVRAAGLERHVPLLVSHARRIARLHARSTRRDDETRVH